jgi:hypothetical protein
MKFAIISGDRIKDEGGRGNIRVTQARSYMPTTIDDRCKIS